MCMFLLLIPLPVSANDRGSILLEATVEDETVVVEELEQPEQNTESYEEPSIDYSDANRIDEEAGEQPIEEDAEVKESSAKKDFYANAKAILTALDEEDLDIDEVKRNAGPVLGKKFNG